MISRILTMISRVRSRRELVMKFTQKNDLWEPKQKNAMVSDRILGLHQSVVFRVAERLWPFYTSNDSPQMVGYEASKIVVCDWVYPNTSLFFGL